MSDWTRGGWKSDSNVLAGFPIPNACSEYAWNLNNYYVVFSSDPNVLDGYAVPTYAMSIESWNLDYMYRIWKIDSTQQKMYGYPYPSTYSIPYDLNKIYMMWNTDSDFLGGIVHPRCGVTASGAFAYTENLTTVNIPIIVNEFGMHTFYKSGIQNLKIPIDSKMYDTTFIADDINISYYPYTFNVSVSTEQPIEVDVAKNLTDGDLITGYFINCDNGEVSANSHASLSRQFVELSSGTYTLSAQSSLGSCICLVYIYDNQLQLLKEISFGTWQSIPFTFTVPNDCYVKFALSYGDGQSDVSDSTFNSVQLEYGSSATTYTSQTYNSALAELRSYITATMTTTNDDGTESVTRNVDFVIEEFDPSEVDAPNTYRTCKVVFRNKVGGSTYQTVQYRIV